MSDALKRVAKPIGLLALVATIGPPVLFLFQYLSQGTMQAVMLVACIVWFITAPLWMRVE